MGLSYPTEPCKEPYNIAPLYAASLGHLKEISDKAAVQIELTLKPTEIKLRIIKKLSKDRVKKSERTFANSGLEHLFNPNTINAMVGDVCNPYT